MTSPIHTLEYVRLQYAVAKKAGDFTGMVKWARAELRVIATQYREKTNV